MQTQVYISLVGPQNSMYCIFFLFFLHTVFSSKFPKYLENTSICGT